MNFSLRPHQLVAHWVPGFVLLLTVQLWRPAMYCKLLGQLPSDRAALTLVWIVSAFVLGQLLDSLRDLLEHCWDHWEGVKRTGEGLTSSTTFISRITSSTPIWLCLYWPSALWRYILGIISRQSSYSSRMEYSLG